MAHPGVSYAVALAPLQVRFHNGLCFFSKYPIVASKLHKHKQSSDVEKYLGTKSMYGNFDIFLGCISHVFRPYVAPHAPCDVLHLAPMLIGC